MTQAVERLTEAELDDLDRKLSIYTALPVTKTSTAGKLIRRLIAQARSSEGAEPDRWQYLEPHEQEALATKTAANIGYRLVSDLSPQPQGGGEAVSVGAIVKVFRDNLTATGNKFDGLEIVNWEDAEHDLGAMLSAAPKAPVEGERVPGFPSGITRGELADIQYGRAALSTPSPRVSVEEIARAVADGFSNGNQQYEDAPRDQQLRYDSAAWSVIARLSPAQDGAE